MTRHTKGTTSRAPVQTAADRHVAKIRTLEVQESLIAGEIEGTRVAISEARRKVRELLVRERLLRREASVLRRQRSALSD